MQTNLSHTYNPTATYNLATVTFALQEQDVQTIYKRERRRVNLHYVFGLIFFAAIAVAGYFLDLLFLTWIACGMAAILTVVYLIGALLAKRDHKKQLRLWKIKLYNYTLDGERIYAAMKDDKYAFHQYSVPLKKVKPSLDGEYFSFHYKGKLRVIPRRVLPTNSPFLQLIR